MPLGFLNKSKRFKYKEIKIIAMEHKNLVFIDFHASKIGITILKFRDGLHTYAVELKSSGDRRKNLYIGTWKCFRLEFLKSSKKIILLSLE
jgi:hypothetical protein